MKIYKSCKVSSCDKVMAAEDDKAQAIQEVVDQKCDELEDDFEYVLAGINKLCREDMQEKAIEVIKNISDKLSEVISDIGDSFAGDYNPEE